jgi:Zn-dependent M28 family amino/carboxypeptidase
MVLTAQPRLSRLDPAAADELRAVRADIDADRIRRHVEHLAEPRSRRHAAEGMARAEGYVTGELRRAGWWVDRRPFPVLDGSGATGVNLLATRSSGTAAPVFVIGAHLDTVPDSPGSDDNASGVACLLELARLLPSVVPDRRARVLLAVFDEEETGLHGSRDLARELATAGPLAGVVVFECIGFVADSDDTQILPPGAGLLYPGQRRQMRRRGWRGDWTLVAYQRRALGLARPFAAGLTQLGGAGTVILARDPLDLPVASRLLRRYLPVVSDFARSDHKPFWDLGVPAIQVTDTANFRNPHYHQTTDEPATLDYQRIADIAAATVHAILAAGRVGSAAD